ARRHGDRLRADVRGRQRRLLSRGHDRGGEGQPRNHHARPALHGAPDRGGDGAMNRPFVVTAIGWLFIATGIVGFVYHASAARDACGSDLIWVEIVRLLAIVAGAFVLRGHNWARWLIVAWMAYHVGLSAFHSPVELVTHVVLLLAISWLLFRPDAS